MQITRTNLNTDIVRAMSHADGREGTDRSDLRHLASLARIFVGAFPPYERPTLRSIADRLQLHHDNYRVDGLLQTSPHVPAEPAPIVGLLTHWQCTAVRYVEHFAVAEHLRGGGIGTQTMRHFISASSLPIVLEVELPCDSITRNRISFYLGLGFRLMPHEYSQPPYRQDAQPVPMHLMAYAASEAETDRAVQIFMSRIVPMVYPYAK